MYVIAEQNSPSDEELIIHEILVEVGDNVIIGQQLFVVEGSKSLFDIESSINGKVVEIYVGAGATVPVGFKIAQLE